MYIRPVHPSQCFKSLSFMIFSWAVYTLALSYLAGSWFFYHFVSYSIAITFCKRERFLGKPYHFGSFFQGCIWVAGGFSLTTLRHQISFKLLEGLSNSQSLAVWRSPPGLALQSLVSPLHMYSTGNLCFVLSSNLKIYAYVYGCWFWCTVSAMTLLSTAFMQGSLQLGGSGRNASEYCLTPYQNIKHVL